jgi:hypothetical protein
MSITKSPGFDTRALTEQIKAALEELKASFPPGVETTLLFQQKDFIDHAIGNLTEAIRDGAIMVTIMLFLFLLNFRTTFITLMAMPLSFAITLLVSSGSASVNSMTLGGLAVAIGMVVDDAIVDVENVFRRLRENAACLIRVRSCKSSAGLRRSAKLHPLRDGAHHPGVPAAAWPERGGREALRSHRHRDDHQHGRVLHRLAHADSRALLASAQSQARATPTKTASSPVA